MKKINTPRRDFIKLSAMSAGSLIAAPVTGAIPVKGNSKLKIVCLGAHPGDPEFGCGGTMAKYSDAGHSVMFIYVTSGGASDPAKSYEEMAGLRMAEARTSCKVLHATPIFFGQPDGNTVLDKKQSDAMDRLIYTLQPDIVFTQWPIDAHPDHQVTGMLGLTLWIRAKRQFHLYFYEVNTGVETMSFIPTDYVDITGVRERKKDAMFAHQTQDPVNTYNDYFKPLEEFRGLQAGVKAAEAFINFKTENERALIYGL